MNKKTFTIIKITFMSVFVVIFGVVYIIFFDDINTDELLLNDTKITNTVVNNNKANSIKTVKNSSSKKVEEEDIKKETITLSTNSNLKDNNNYYSENEYIIEIIPINDIIEDLEDTDVSEHNNSVNLADTSDNITELDNSSNAEYELININTADVNELTELPSIGESIANLIIEYRNEYGLFTDISQIKNVKKIGNKTYEKIKNLITIE